MVVHASMEGAMFNYVGRETGVHGQINCIYVRGLARDVDKQSVRTVCVRSDRYARGLA